MMRFTINRALLFAATCSVAAHGSFALMSSGFAPQSANPSVDRDSGTQASELVQVAGVLSADITEKTQPEHLQPVDTEQPKTPDTSAEKLHAQADTIAPEKKAIDQATIHPNNDPPVERSVETPSLNTSHEFVERVASTNTVQSNALPEGRVPNATPNALTIKLLAHEINTDRTDADTLPVTNPETVECKSEPVIEQASIMPIRPNSPQRETPSPPVDIEQLARVTPKVEFAIDPMLITVPNRGNAQDTVVSDSNTGEEQLPMISKNRDPKYPSLLLAKGIGGVVRLRVVVNQNGLVDQLNVDRSSGHKAFDDAAILAVRAWEFEPAVREGKAVSMEIIVPIRFKPVK